MLYVEADHVLYRGDSIAISSINHWVCTVYLEFWLFMIWKHIFYKFRTKKAAKHEAASKALTSFVQFKDIDSALRQRQLTSGNVCHAPNADFTSDQLEEISNTNLVTNFEEISEDAQMPMHESKEENVNCSSHSIPQIGKRKADENSKR